MRRKRNILTNEVYNHKARLNIHGGQQEFTINFFDTYSPVINWFAIRILLIHTVIFKWHTRQIDFVLAYPQADIEIPLYMKVPAGIKVKGKKGKKAVLKLIKNLYGQKQAGRVWFKHLTSKLKKIGFEPSEVDECIFYKGSCVFFFYVDDGIFLSPDKTEVSKAIDDLKSTGLDLEDRGNISDYLGINFNYETDGTITMSQPQLINQLLQAVNQKPNAHLPDTPAVSSRLLRREKRDNIYSGKFHYRSVIGQLNYLEKCT